MQFVRFASLIRRFDFRKMGTKGFSILVREFAFATRRKCSELVSR